MKILGHVPILGIFIFCAVAFTSDTTQLSELYKAGKVRFEKEFVLDDDAMPEDVFFENPSTITCDRQGSIYVVDSGATNVKKFDANGKFIKVFGREGQGPGEFGRLFYSAFAKDHLILWDSGNRRLCAFTPDGKFIDSANIPYDVGSVRKLRGLPTGEVLVEMEKTFRNDPNKPQECKIELYSQELKFVRNIYERSLWRKRYIRTKEYGTTVLYFPYSADVQWDVTPDGRIVIGYSEDYNVEVYDSSGKRISTISHAYEPVKVTERDKKDFFDSISFYRMGERLKDPPEYVTKYTEFPTYKPVYKNIMTDEEGNILAVLNRENRDEDGKVFDVFDPAGEFISRVFSEGDAVFPDNRNAYLLHKGSLLLIQTGEDDLYRIVRYKIDVGTSH